MKPGETNLPDASIVRARARREAVSDRRDAAVFHGDVRDVPRVTRAIQHPPAGKDEVELRGL